MVLNLHEVLENVKGWVVEVGEYQLKKSDEGYEYSTKSTATDMVTEVDRYSDEFLTQRILKEYSKHSILSEEQGVINEGNEYEWIVDPLDGTTSYVHKFPTHSISIALQKNEEIVLAVVYVPRLKELFYAIKGEGAYLNDERIEVTNTSEFNKCLLATGFPYDKHYSEHNNLNLFNKILPQTQDCRRTGSAAFDLCSVACGRIDGYWELKIQKWDVAAGELIIKEAGGAMYTSRMLKENGELAYNVVCGNKVLADKLIKEINSVYRYF